MNSNELQKKLSPLLSELTPEFIRADHPQFVEFLKTYYEFLEAGELKLIGTNNYVIQETNTVNFILDQGEEKVVLEDSDAKFTVGEIIVGQDSGATATVLVDDFDDNSRLFISAQQQFITNEEVVGQTSGASALISEYRANPVQNIQQLLQYKDPDYTISDFLANFRDAFLEGIPSSLADGVSKRNLIKNIRDLYSAKGTQKGHELFFRLLLDETAEITFPRDNILRTSDGQWSTDTVMRVVENGTSDFIELIGQTITGATSGATAIVSTVTKFREGSVLVAELSLDAESIEGTFTAGENVEGISTVLDLTISAVVKSVLVDANILRSGAYYSVGDAVTISTGGNEAAQARIGQIKSGGIDEVVIADGGTGYAIGDTVTFDNTNTNGTGAVARITSVGGGVELETATAPDQIITEDGDNVIVEHTDNYELEDATVNTAYLVDETDEDNLIFEDGGLVVAEFDAVELARQQSLSTDLSGDLILEDGNQLLREDTENFFLTQQQSVNGIENLILEDGEQIVLETGTFADLGVASEASEIARVKVISRGNGYESLPIVSVTSGSGSGANLLAKSTSGVGGIQSLDITNFGLDYGSAPTLRLNRILLIKTVTGTFTSGDNLTSHSGSVVSFDSARGLLNLDTDANFNDGDNITTITGATAEVVHAPFATAESVIGTVGTQVGQFVTDRGKVSVDTMRIQDSFFYQDYSYVVRIGESINIWRDSLRRSVHPAGWNVFGEVSFTTSVSARIQTPAGGATTFTPDLASLFETVFAPIVPRRLGTVSDGTELVDGDIYSNIEDIPSGKRELTLVSAVSVRMDTNRGSFGSGNRLTNLTKYAFAVPPIFTAGRAWDYPGIDREVTAPDDITRDLYTIDQFGHYRINQIVDYGLLKLEEGYELENDFILMEDGSYMEQEEISITDFARNTRINVPPPSRITIDRGGLINTFDNDFLTFDDGVQTFDEDGTPLDTEGRYATSFDEGTVKFDSDATTFDAASGPEDDYTVNRFDQNIETFDSSDDTFDETTTGQDPLLFSSINYTYDNNNETLDTA